MNSTFAHPLPGREEVILWLAVAAGPIIWAIHLPAVYYVASNGCQVMSDAGVRILIVALGLVAASIAVAGALVAYRRWDDWSAQSHPLATAPNRPTFMAQAAMALGLLFAFGILAETIPALFLEACT